MASARKILRYLLGTPLLIFLAAMLVFQIPSFQTSVARAVVGKFAGIIDGKMQIGSIHLKFANTLVLRDVCIEDCNAPRDYVYDTLLSAGSISVRFSLLGLLSHDCISLRSVKLKDVRFNLVIDTLGNYQNNISRIFRLPPPDTTKEMSDKPLLHIDRIVAENLGYGMRNYIVPSRIMHPWNVDWQDLDVSGACIKASDFNIRDAHFTGNMEEFSCREKSGWGIRQLSCRFSVGKGEVDLLDAHYADCFGSEFFFDYRMTGGIRVYSDYINKVHMDAVFRKARVSMSTLARVIPPMYEDSTTFATLTGHAYGPVADLHADGLELGFENSRVRARVDGRVSGLPDIYRMRIDTRISQIRFTTAELTRILNSIIQKKKLDLSGLGRGATYRGEVNTRGLLDALDAQIAMEQFKGNEMQGKLNLNVRMDNVLPDPVKSLSIKADLSSSEFDVQTVMAGVPVNDLSMTAGLGLNLPSDGSGIQMAMDSLSIRNMEFNGHVYSGISGFASLLDRDLNAGLQARDPALNADIDIWTEPDEYQALVKIKAADLNMMNFDSRKVSIAHGTVCASLEKNFKNPQGSALVSDILLYSDAGPHRVDDIKINAIFEEDQYDISVESGLTEGGFHGMRDSFTSYMKLGATHELLNFIKPGLYIEKGTAISARRDSTGYLYGAVESGRLALGRNYVRNLSAAFSGPPDSLEARIISDDIALADFHFGNNCIDAAMVKKKLSVNYEYACDDSGHVFEGQISGGVQFNDDSSLDIKLDPSYFVTGNERWDMNGSTMHIDGTEISIGGFAINSGSQHVMLDGRVRDEQTDTLDVSVSNMDISFLNALIRDRNFDLHGILNANGKIISPRNAGAVTGLPGMEIKVRADSLRMKGRDYGCLEALSVYEHSGERFRIDFSDRIADRQALSGNIYLSKSDRSMTLDAKMDRFPFGFLSAFTEGVFSDFDGTASAQVSISKKGEDLDLYCKEGRIDGGLLGIAFTNVPYNIDGTFSMDNSGIHLKDMKLHDRAGGTGVAQGGVTWDRLKNIQMDMSLKVKDMEALNIPSGVRGSIFYGNAIASGNVVLKGPFQNLLLAADVKTTGPSEMHFVVSDDMDASKGKLLSFVDPGMKDIDPYIKMMQEQQTAKEAAAGMNLKLRVEADQNFHANLDMTGTGFAAGASGVGKGQIDVDVDTGTGTCLLLGDYMLEEGIFDFNASDIVHRQFKIKDGSMVKFNGEIQNTELNVRADYQTKASIAPLISDTTSVSNRRLVNCGITLKNKLTSPSIAFSIDIPDLDPQVQAAVESALNSEAKVQRQFLSLLVSNNFLPDEQSGIFDNSSVFYSNVSELMATQINNIFNKLDIPLDLGLNYQPSDNGGASMFDVAISTQLWNNRVVIGGSLGNRQSTSSTSATLFGDLDIEYKVTKNGALRVKAFTHAADQYSNYLDQSQRNGIGATWQQEYDDFCTWCKVLFMKKADKLKYQEEQVRKSKQTVKLVLDE